ncbi:hypothetical protein V7112_22925 [Bacillus sp. JJ1566]|uniref:Nmad3 family putative nucleotide modification protein n=1 Tax=Bacillus sp. JJ1566 TaxID=3122961 RepID=UPI002FFF508B
MKNLLIKYIFRGDNHVDPNFTFLTYGDSGSRASQISNTVESGSYVFFHTSFDRKAYITAYFYVERILNKNDNPAEIATLNTDSKADDVIILGSRERSKILTFPLPFDRTLAEQLTSLKIGEDRFKGNLTELQVISNSTRSHRRLSNTDTDFLLKQCLNRG